MSASSVKPKPTSSPPPKPQSTKKTSTPAPAKPAQTSKPAPADSAKISKEATGSSNGNGCRALLQGLKGWASGGAPEGAKSNQSPSTAGSNSNAGGYQVKSGDTLWDIAQRNGTDLATLLEANPQFKANPDLIHPGDQVNLPGQSPKKDSPETQNSPNGAPAPSPAPSSPAPTEGTTAPAATPTAGNGQGDPIGLAALNYGADGQTVNPNTGDTNWYMWCLGWTNRAIHNAGGDVPELRAGTASEAYRNALNNGKIQHGNPPPGAIVFFPEAANGVGHVGIVGEDGTSYRGTVPPSESATTIGDRPIPGIDGVAWMMPSG